MLKSRGKIKKRRRRFPWIKAQLQNFRTSWGKLSQENDVVLESIVHPFPSWNRGTHLQKKKKKHQWLLLDPIISPNASQNADQIVHYKSSIDLTHCAPTIRLWCQEKPSPTGQQWQDCWCPNPIKLGANFYLHTRSQSQEDKDWVSLKVASKSRGRKETGGWKKR